MHYVVLRVAEHGCCAGYDNPNVHGIRPSPKNQQTACCIVRFDDAPLQQFPFTIVARESGRDLERDTRFREAAELAKQIAAHAFEQLVVLQCGLTTARLSSMIGERTRPESSP